jgi:hypothetical protein
MLQQKTLDSPFPLTTIDSFGTEAVYQCAAHASKAIVG